MLQFFEGIKRHVQFVIWHFIHSKKQNILYTYYNVRQIIKNRRSKLYSSPWRRNFFFVYVIYRGKQTFRLVAQEFGDYKAIAQQDTKK